MQIKEVAEKTGLTKKAIRYYEECGFIEPKKMQNGYKNYEESDISVLVKIKKLRLLEFSVQEIREYMGGDVQKVIEKKLKDNEQVINRTKEANKKIKKLLDEEMGVDARDIQKMRNSQVKVMRKNLIFGIVNVISLILIFRFHINTDMNLLSLLAMYVVGSASMICQSSRRAKQRKKGKILYERYLPDYVFPLLANIFAYNIAICVAKSCLQSIGTIDWFNSLGNAMLSVFMMIMIILLTLASFCDSLPKDIEFSKI